MHELMRCVILGCQLAAADRFGIYCAPHRQAADDGSLWLRCIFVSGHAPVAPHDLLACTEHRRQIDEAVRTDTDSRGRQAA